MLMGDVAKKAFNMLTRKSVKKNIIPSVSTYRLRNSEIYYGDIRIMRFFRSFVGWPFSNIKLSTSSFSFKRLKINSFVI